tara:strand:- start:918 stop:1151 length:234 start_codon:yes stop_codon:yes gene_type:complete
VEAWSLAGYTCPITEPRIVGEILSLPLVKPAKSRLFLQVSCPFGLAMPVKLRTIRTLFSHIYKLMVWAGRATGGYAA